MNRLKTPNTVNRIILAAFYSVLGIAFIVYVPVLRLLHLLGNIVNFNALYLLMGLGALIGFGASYFILRTQIWGYMDNNGVGYHGITKQYPMFKWEDVQFKEIIQSKDGKQYLFLSVLEIPEYAKKNLKKIANPTAAFVVECTEEVLETIGKYENRSSAIYE